MTHSQNKKYKINRKSIKRKPIGKTEKKWIKTCNEEILNIRANMARSTKADWRSKEVGKFYKVIKKLTSWHPTVWRERIIIMIKKFTKKLKKRAKKKRISKN